MEPANKSPLVFGVPVFNEEGNVGRLLTNLGEFSRAEDRECRILICNDGSTDKTWQHIQKYANNPQIQIFRKENGGKYTALNYGIERSQADLVGCLDADSFVDKDTLRRVVRYFTDPKIMAVTPAIKIFKPKNLVQAIDGGKCQIGIVVPADFSSKLKSGETVSIQALVDGTDSNSANLGMSYSQAVVQSYL